VDPETYLLYLKGMYYWDKRTADGFQKAKKYLNQAIDKDSLLPWPIPLGRETT